MKYVRIFLILIIFWLMAELCFGGIGEDLVTNGTFTTDTAWTKDALWGIDAGAAGYVSNLGGEEGQSIYQEIAIVAGERYLVQFDILGYAEDSRHAYELGGASSIIQNPGAGNFPTTITEYVVAGSEDSYIKFVAGDYTAIAGLFTIDNVSVKPIIGPYVYRVSGITNPTSLNGTYRRTGTDAIYEQVGGNGEMEFDTYWYLTDGTYKYFRATGTADSVPTTGWLGMITVSGTLSPDVTGEYLFDGIVNTEASYKRVGLVGELQFYNALSGTGAYYYLSSTAGVSTPYRWYRNEGNGRIGAYPALGDATGTATVTGGGEGTITIRTPHQGARYNSRYNGPRHK